MLIKFYILSGLLITASGNAALPTCAYLLHLYHEPKSFEYGEHYPSRAVLHWYDPTTGSARIVGEYRFDPMFKKFFVVEIRGENPAQLGLHEVVPIGGSLYELLPAGKMRLTPKIGQGIFWEDRAIIQMRVVGSDVLYNEKGCADSSFSGKANLILVALVVTRPDYAQGRASEVALATLELTDRSLVN
jgi:hypothetical protein